MNDSRVSFLLSAAIALGLIALPNDARAQWWSREPVDYEDCAERADKKADSKQQRETMIAACEAKFAGRRKPGGGYTYYDFMQDKHFDIAGPNPTAEEQRDIDRHYTEFLDQRRRSLIAAAFAQRQRELSEASSSAEAAKAPQTTGQVRSAKTPPAPPRRPAAAQSAKPAPAAPRTVVANLPAPPLPKPLRAAPATPPRPAAAVSAAQRPKPAARAKRNACKEPSLSCNWSRFTDGVSDMTRGLFRPAKSQAEASGPRG